MLIFGSALFMQTHVPETVRNHEDGLPISCPSTLYLKFSTNADGYSLAEESTASFLEKRRGREIPGNNLIPNPIQDKTEHLPPYYYPRGSGAAPSNRPRPHGI